MSKFCTSCGATLADDKKFCTQCGAVVDQATPAASTPTPPPTPPTVNSPFPTAAMDAPPPKGSKYEPISTGGYIGIMLLMCIPVLGIILCIIWACGGCRKVNKRSLARASLIMMAIGLVLGLIFSLLAGALFNSISKEIEKEIEKETGISISEVAKEESGASGILGGLLGKSTSESETEDSASELGALLGFLGSIGDGDDGNSSITNRDIEALEELEKTLEGIEGMEGSGLDNLIEEAEKVNREAEALNDGWPSTLRTYPGGTATAVASYRTEISGTTQDEMMSWIEDLKSDGFVFQDFYGFGMTEADMLSVGGWWATDGNIYLSLSFYEGTLTIDHTKELPDLSGIFGD